MHYRTWLHAAGRFRHLPVIEDGEVVALLDITKCLYDAIARMEKAMEKGHAIAAAMEGMGNAQSEWGGERKNSVPQLSVTVQL